MAIRRTLHRIEHEGHARYLTCSCYRQLPLFQNDRIKDAFVDHLSFTQRTLGFELFAWVIMPEHIHLLLRPATTAESVTKILRRVKSPFGRRVIERWRTLDAPILDRLTQHRARPRFWQAGGGYDRNITTEAEYLEKIDYIHANPVRRGLTECPLDYRWSSAIFYEQEASYHGPQITRLTS